MQFSVRNIKFILTVYADPNTANAWLLHCSDLVIFDWVPGCVFRRMPVEKNCGENGFESFLDKWGVANIVGRDEFYLMEVRNAIGLVQTHGISSCQSYSQTGEMSDQITKGYGRHPTAEWFRVKWNKFTYYHWRNQRFQIKEEVCKNHL